jgi:hypothetical protein
MRRLARFSTGVLLLLGCAEGATPRPSRSTPGIVIPTTLGEGHQSAAPNPAEAPAPVASNSAAPAPSAVPPQSPAPQGAPPDPEPLRLADQWEYDLQMKSGQIAVLSTQRRHFAPPLVSARRFGRYAIELWIGHELIDRVRFDFAGLALEKPVPTGPRHRLYSAPDLTSGAEVRQKVLVPASPRARRAVLVDRATGSATPLPWPPDQPLPPPTLSAEAPTPSAEPAPAPSPSP